MPYIKFSLSFLAAAAIYLCHSEIKAEEQGAKPAPEAAAAEAGAEAEAEGVSGGEKNGPGADREWAKRKSKINVLEAKMKELKKKIQGYIALKKSGGVALDDKGKPIDVLAAIVTSHKELKEATQDYSKESDELRFRFPEQGQLIEKKYIPLRVQTLEQIENEMGLGGELTRTKKKIDKKYSIFVGDDLIKPPPPELHGEDSTIKETHSRGDEPKRLKLSK